MAFETTEVEPSSVNTFDIPPIKEPNNVKPINTFDTMDQQSDKENSIPLVQTKFGGINNWFWLSKKS